MCSGGGGSRLRHGAHGADLRAVGRHIPAHALALLQKDSGFWVNCSIRCVSVLRDESRGEGPRGGLTPAENLVQNGTAGDHEP